MRGMAIALWILCIPVLYPQSGLISPEIVDKASKSVVLLKGAMENGTVLGSGFLISSDGKVATNLHVIREMKTGGVQLQSGELFDSFSVLAFDERKDLAIVQIAGFDLPAIELGNSNEVRPGEPVIAIGSPRGLQGTVTSGVVSAVRDDPGAAGYKVIQTDAASNPGNSGGPLINGKGQVIGVVTAKLRGSDGLNFAVPVNYVRGLMTSLGKPLNLDGLRAAVKNLPSDAFKDAPSFPTNWKSIGNGSKFHIRKDGDVIYAEWAPPEEAVRLGYFSELEVRKQKDGYSGRRRDIVACTIGYGIYQRINHCPFETVGEVSVFTESRIEGRVMGPPNDAKLDCKKCTYNKPSIWLSFVWIPE